MIRNNRLVKGPRKKLRKRRKYTLTHNLQLNISCYDLVPNSTFSFQYTITFGADMKTAAVKMEVKSMKTTKQSRSIT